MNLKSNFKRNISLIQESMNWEPSLIQIEQFTHLQFLLSKWNKKVNLTRLINGNDFWVSQVIDSLWPIREICKDQKNSTKIIDVGSGCGLPGLAFAIALPKTSLTLVDSLMRKTNALQEITRELGMTSRVLIINERIENLGQDIHFRGTYDMALARAVGPSPVVAEYLIPLLNQTGEALIYKGKWSSHDEKSLKNALIELKAEIKAIRRIDLPKGRGSRHVISISKSGECPSKYPRSNGIPNKKPLGT